MNRQPFGTPPRWWASAMSPTLVRLSAPWRRWELTRKQRIAAVEMTGYEHLRAALADGAGVMLCANHSAHYDSNALYCAFDRQRQPVHFMTAWQVFEMSSPFERWGMSRLGCFSIDRESNDKNAFRQATEILTTGSFPLVIFPEGDILHCTDRITPFREGAAAIALAAARKAVRPVVVIPTAIKFVYLEDPTPQLLTVMEELERRFYLRTLVGTTLVERIYRLAEGLIAIKELDYLGRTESGSLRERMDRLMGAVLSDLEQRHRLRSEGTIPERVKEVRRTLIIAAAKLDSDTETNGAPPKPQDPRLWTVRETARLGEQSPWETTPKRRRIRLSRERPLAKSLTPRQRAFKKLDADMEDLFFVTQVYSYPGSYLRDNPSVERIAETIDKLEEDILSLNAPRVRGRRRVVIRLGAPLAVESLRGRDAVAAVTASMHAAVQAEMDALIASERASLAPGHPLQPADHIPAG